jgi:hypothetical protein
VSPIAEVVFSYDHNSEEFGSHKAGDRVEVDDRAARRLIQAGEAVPATKPAAVQIGANPETAATAKAAPKK